MELLDLPQDTLEIIYIVGNAHTRSYITPMWIHWKSVSKLFYRIHLEQRHTHPWWETSPLTISIPKDPLDHTGKWMLTRAEGFREYDSVSFLDSHSNRISMSTRIRNMYYIHDHVAVIGLVWSGTIEWNDNDPTGTETRWVTGCMLEGSMYYPEVRMNIIQLLIDIRTNSTIYSYNISGSGFIFDLSSPRTIQYIHNSMYNAPVYTIP